MVKIIVLKVIRLNRSYWSQFPAKNHSEDTPNRPFLRNKNKQQQLTAQLATRYTRPTVRYTKRRLESLASRHEVSQFVFVLTHRDEFTRSEAVAMFTAG